MKHRLAATALILMLPLGMAACGSTQSTADACKEIATARDAVLKESESVDISSMNSQQEYAVFLAKMTGIYKESAKKVTNKDVKTAFKDVLDDLDKLVNLLNTDENASTSPDYESIQDNMDTHGEALNNLCGFTWNR